MQAAAIQTSSIVRIRPLISPREKEVLFLLSNGYVTREIASSLFISDHTVNDHRKALMSKLGARNVAQMIRRGFELNILNASI